MRKHDIPRISPAHQKKRRQAAAKQAYAASAQKRRAVSDAAIEEHCRPVWHLRKPSLGELVKISGVSINTMVRRLGLRTKAQRAYEHRVELEAKTDG